MYITAQWNHCLHISQLVMKLVINLMDGHLDKKCLCLRLTGRPQRICLWAMRGSWLKNHVENCSWWFREITGKFWFGSHPWLTAIRSRTVSQTDWISQMAQGVVTETCSWTWKKLFIIRHELKPWYEQNRNTGLIGIFIPIKNYILIFLFCTFILIFPWLRFMAMLSICEDGLSVDCASLLLLLSVLHLSCTDHERLLNFICIFLHPPQK